MTALAPGLRRAEWAAPVCGALLAVAVVTAAPGTVLPIALVALAIGLLVTWIVWQDLATLTISDSALLAVAAVAVAVRWSDASALGEAPWHTLLAIALDVGLCGGMLLLFREGYYRLKGVDGLGLGDVKLAAAGAILVGGVGFSWALLAASMAGLAAVGVARLRDRRPVDRLAFGAVLAPAIWGVWLIEQALPRLSGG